MWRVLGASVAGTSHLKNGCACDDAIAYQQLKNGTLLMAVADGAGSATQSAAGATSVVKTALNTAETALSQQTEPFNEQQWEEMLNTVLQTVRTVLEKLAFGDTASDDTMTGGTAGGVLQFATLPLREFATTLLFAVVSPQEVAVVQIGDGVVVVQYADGELEALTTPDHGEYINETSFITDHDYLKRIQFKVLQVEIQGIALLTDGLQMLAIDLATNNPYKPFFGPLFKFSAMEDATEAELTAFLESERVCARTDDDKTLVLAVRE
jgi:serine/threonine protein phosphatase PrpC